MASSALRDAIKRVRPSIGEDMNGIVRWMARHAMSRKVLNVLYASLSYGGMQRFHSRFAELLLDREQRMEPGTWSVSFAGKRVMLPFSGRDAWLEWGAALGILGHDVEVKRTYETLIRGAHPPRLVLDVGTNIGLHSLLFLAHGIRTVSFEPNPACHPYFRAAARLNGVECDIRQLALGAEEGTAELAFPGAETWLGTTVAEARERLSARGNLVEISVPRTTLDAFCRLHGLIPDLVKIDTEGNERDVLMGGLGILESARPLVIFESWPGESRNELFTLLENVGYRLRELPLTRDPSPTFLDRKSFASSPATNFAATPHEPAP